jgi:hypothetical protein
VEVVVAVAIMAIVFTGLWGTYAGVMNAAGNVEDAVAVEQEGRAILTQLADDLGSLHFPLENSGAPDYPYHLSAPEFEEPWPPGEPILELATCARLDFSTAFPGRGVVKARYLLLPSRAEAAGLAGHVEDPMRLYRRQLDNPGLAREPWNAVELSDRVRELRLTWIDHGGEEHLSWSSRERATQGGEEVLPSRARLVLVLERQGVRREFSLLVDLGARDLAGRGTL